MTDFEKTYQNYNPRDDPLELHKRARVYRV